MVALAAWEGGVGHDRATCETDWVVVLRWWCARPARARWMRGVLLRFGERRRERERERERVSVRERERAPSLGLLARQCGDMAVRVVPHGG